MFKPYAFLFLLLTLSCIGQNPCEHVTCSYVCRGEDLWEQKCVNGECTDYQIVQENAPSCGYDPCRNTICSYACYGTELWKMKCVDGRCVQDVITEKNSAECGFIRSPPQRIVMLGALEAEEYAVYSALLETGGHLIASWYTFDEIEVIIVYDHTSMDCTILWYTPNETLAWVGERIAVNQETLHDFSIKNSQEHPLGDHFNVEVPIFLFGEGGKLPEDIKFWSLTLSRVGFNFERDQALVYVESVCSPLYGRGYFVLLTKKNGVWTITDELLCWLS